ncbi:hypothetical protein JAAARDRAFT_32245 [Jaapia argillacea MUCL 33604]|uniref:Uncharacterized protein n=1 Tax=Jaapia argillacea MUCL 33604 TaxID=933084 RepID=A0A067QF55_9AGAM|nr:hypothetical protein JAAARDRAFT_32245 [Jaapia argillacea MUCL 33604]
MLAIEHPIEHPITTVTPPPTEPSPSPSPPRRSLTHFSSLNFDSTSITSPPSSILRSSLSGSSSSPSSSPPSSRDNSLTFPSSCDSSSSSSSHDPPIPHSLEVEIERALRPSPSLPVCSTTSSALNSSGSPSIKFAPLPETEKRTRHPSFQLGVGARSRMLRNRKMMAHDPNQPPSSLPPTHPNYPSYHPDAVNHHRRSRGDGTRPNWSDIQPTPGHGIGGPGHTEDPIIALGKLVKDASVHLWRRVSTKKGEVVMSGGGPLEVVKDGTHLFDHLHQGGGGGEDGHGQGQGHEGEGEGRVWEEEISEEFMKRYSQVLPREGEKEDGGEAKGPPTMKKSGIKVGRSSIKGR